MPFDSYWLSRLSGAEYTSIEAPTHSNGAEVGHLGNINMQASYAWASTHSSSSSISFSRCHFCCSIVCVNRLLGEFQRDNIAREIQMLHLWRQGTTLDHMRPGGFVLSPSPAEPMHLRVSQAPMPGNTSSSYTENRQSPPAQNYGPNDVSHVSPRRILLDEGVPAPVNTPPSFSTFVKDGKKRYRCECGTETAREGDMKRHHKYALYHSQPQFVCDHCCKTLTRKDSCDAHKKTCPGIIRNKFST